MEQGINHMIIKNVSIMVVVASLSGCLASMPRNGLLTATGAAVGGGAGYLIGDAIGGQHATLIGTGAGVIIGGLLGNQIAQYLDERDRQIASKATEDALNTPIPDNQAGNNHQTPTIVWNSDHNPGVRGRTTIVNTGYDTSGRECRAAEEVAYVGGREIKEQVSFCRDKNSGAWAKAV